MPHVKICSFKFFLIFFLHRPLQKTLPKYTSVYSYTKAIQLLNVKSQLHSELVAMFFSITLGNSELRVKQLFEMHIPPF